MTIVDANVVVKWFVLEADWETARKVGRASSLAAPSHVVVEVGRALLRNMRSELISRDDVRQALRGLPSLVRLVATETLIEMAFEIATSSSVTIYDALYVAAAIQADDVLVTADARLVRGLRNGPWQDRAMLIGDWAALQRKEL